MVEENIIDNYNDFEYLEKAILQELCEVSNDFKENLKQFNIRKAFEIVYLFIIRISEIYFNVLKSMCYGAIIHQVMKIPV